MEITGFKQEFHVPSGDALAFEVKKSETGPPYLRIDLPRELRRAKIWIPLVEGEIQVEVTIELHRDGRLEIAAGCEGFLWD
jgi:hypothetical protein